MPSYSRRVSVPGKTAQELYDTVSGDIERFLTKSSLGKVELERDPGKKEFLIKATVFSATLACMEGEMELDAKLSLFAAPFKSKLDDSITRWLTKTFQLNIT